MRRISRRAFIGGAALLLPGAIAADATYVEPARIVVKRLKIGERPTPCRIAQITDIHHKGNRARLDRMVRLVNSLKPDCVCFTGDLVEEKTFVTEALEYLGRIEAPLFGIPGNHDFWADVDFDEYGETFRRKGGQFLMDGKTTWADLEIWGVTGGKPPPFAFTPGKTRILLSHYPNWFETIPESQFHLILAGHSHGGQIRIPGYGSLLVPFNVGRFELGFYQTPSGPMYVNPGIGSFFADVRFCCPPEITLFEV